MSTNEELLSMLDDIDDNGYGLTDWEIEFVNQMLVQVDEEIEFTEKQGAAIEKIYAKRV